MIDDTIDGWWRSAVIYEIYVRSFADSTGDGVGDIRGITGRLGELAELGVDAIWLTPFYPSPMADGGYDVADYRLVDPRLGTLDDFDAMVVAAHGLGIRVIVDVVPNHTSSSHAWFQAALAAPPGSPERARYIFRDGRGPDGAQPPADWHSNFGGSAWSRVADGQWYLHLFAPEQPDLDWSNPDVRADFESTLRFWLDRGVDGFRIDVAHGLVKNLTEPLIDLGSAAVDKTLRAGVADHPLWDRDDVHKIYREWRSILDKYSPPRMAVAEAWVAPGRLGRYVRGDELHQAFNFQFLLAPWQCEVFANVIDASLAESAAVGATTTWVLSNHDVIRHPTRYALPPDVNDAVWLMSDGKAPVIDKDRGLRRGRAATLLMLALPGSAYLYQGEELGLHEVADLPRELLQDPTWKRSGHREKGRDGCRVPLPWEAHGPSLGFGPGPAWLPQPQQWAEIARTRQAEDDTSTLALYRKAIRLRRDLGGDGTLEWLRRGSQTLVFRRDNGLICIVNFGPDAVALPTGELLVASDVLTRDGLLPTDTAAWLR
jgi:alpha-glucosidase